MSGKLIICKYIELYSGTGYFSAPPSSSKYRAQLRRRQMLALLTPTSVKSF